MKNNARHDAFLCVLAFMLAAMAMLLPSSALAESPGGSKLDLQAIDAFFQSQVASKRIPGMAVVIVEGDQVILEHGYGSAGGNEPVTPQTQFYIGSCTKSFTALAVMQLVEQGKLELDAPVQRYLPWFRVADEAASAQITVRHLLNQTSGLSDTGDPESKAQFASLTEQAHALNQARLTAPVGTTFQYYSQNYRVLGLIVEQVSGQTYDAYMRDHVFSPLAMPQTVTRPTDAAHLTQGYGQVFGLPLARSQSYYGGSLPSGYLISTADDLGHYLIALINSGQYGNTRILQPAALAQLFTPPTGIHSEQVAAPSFVTQMFPAATDLKSDYGMGWIVLHSADGVELVSHNGNLDNFHADMLLLPKLKRGFFILTNQGSLTRSMLDSSPTWLGLTHLLLGTPPPPPASFDWVYVVLALIVATHWGSDLYRLARLPRWGQRIAKRSRLIRWLSASIDVVVPLALLGLPLFLGMILGLGGKGSWSDLYGLLPDIAIWLIVAGVLGLIRGVGKVVILARQAR